MGRDPVYKDLIAERNLSRLKEEYEVSGSLNFSDPKPYFLLEEKFRDRILKDFFEVKELNFYEERLAKWYLSRDFRIALLLAECSLRGAQIIEPKEEEQKQEIFENLEMALRTSIRAGKSLEAAKFIFCKDYTFGEDYELSKRLLRDFNRKIYLFNEYGDREEILFKLEKEKEIAMIAENYERIPRLVKLIEQNLEKNSQV